MRRKESLNIIYLSYNYNNNKRHGTIIVSICGRLDGAFLENFNHSIG
jgi:hypothetical protein